MAKKPTKADIRVRENELLPDLNFLEDDIPVEKVKPKLDMFTQVLPAINRGDYGFYSQLPDEQKKLYQAYVIHRWLGNAPGPQARDYVANVNEFVNVDFWTLSGQHTELQHMLMCVAAKLSNGLQPAPQRRHQWLAFMGGKRAESKINKFLLDKFPQLRDDELELWKRETTVDEFTEFVKAYGVQDKDAKELIKLYKAEKKKVGTK